MEALHLPLSPMNEVSASKFYESIAGLKEFFIKRLDEKSGELIGHIDTKHASLRETMTDIDDKLDMHRDETNKLGNRITSIESRIETEAKQAVKTTTWVAMLVSAAMSALGWFFHK